MSLIPGVSINPKQNAITGDINQCLLILEKLRTISGNEQLDYLKNNKNDLLKQILYYTYNPHLKYKIDEGKYDKIYVEQPTECNNLSLQDWKCFTNLLDKLSNIKSAKDEEVFKIKQFIYKYTQCDFLKQVLFKDLRLNMSVIKFKKVWNDFIEENLNYPYMGCRSFNKKNLAGIIYPAYAQTKMDGSFCNVIVDMDNKTVEYISRQSKPQPMQGCFLDRFCDNWVGDVHFTNKFVLTGEVLVWDNNKNRPLPRKLSNGILRREDKTQDELDRIHFVCWDFIPYKNFVEKKWDVPYKDRYTWLKTRLGEFMGKLHIVNTWVVNNIDEAMAKFEEQYALGEEGIVLKSFNQIWQNGKPVGQVKIKAEKDCELQMVDFMEGKGNYSGMCGAIRCISNDGKLEVNVKPRTPADAKVLWDNQDQYKNKILTVKFNEVIQSDTKDCKSLYLPVFVEIRNDKDVADSVDYIISME